MRDQFYGYLNPESTKTVSNSRLTNRWFYGYLNPESTKTIRFRVTRYTLFYGYLNPESTKTQCLLFDDWACFTVT